MYSSNLKGRILIIKFTSPLVGVADAPSPTRGEGSIFLNFAPETRACRQFYYAGQKSRLFCAPLLKYLRVCSATVLKNPQFLPQPTELMTGPS